MAEALEKDDLYNEALEKFGVILDRKRKLEELRAQVEKLRQGASVEGLKFKDAQKYVRTRLLRNRITGVIWPYNEAYAKNPDLEPYFGEEWDNPDLQRKHEGA